NIGINFQQANMDGAAVYSLTGPRPLFFANASSRDNGNLILLADDRTLLSELLHNLTLTPREDLPASATFIAVFNHSSQRAPYLGLSSLIDGTNHQGPGTANNAASREPAIPETPTFFARNLGSLSETFSALQSERVVEQDSGSNVRETVTYIWEPQ
ncbi:MAG TPA: hypothetical protein VGU23_07990, partial [Acidobacteriaceae bacterium]|nr:hypothetical protein [Acidobacteriaceae bacterium]